MGVVTERLMYSGEYRHETNHLMTIAQIDRLNVEAFLPVTFYRQISVGMVAEVRPAEPIGGVYDATVTVVDRVLDAASSTFRVRSDLAEPGLSPSCRHSVHVEFPVTALRGPRRPEMSTQNKIGRGYKPANGARRRAAS